MKHRWLGNQSPLRRPSLPTQTSADYTPTRFPNVLRRKAQSEEPLIRGAPETAFHTYYREKAREITSLAGRSRSVEVRLERSLSSSSEWPIASGAIGTMRCRPLLPVVFGQQSSVPQQGPPQVEASPDTNAQSPRPDAMFPRSSVSCPAFGSPAATRNKFMANRQVNSRPDEQTGSAHPRIFVSVR
jgi:hypothetical protein